jgi:hypothetical protein
MSSTNDVFAPVGWDELAPSARSPGVFVKTLRAPGAAGQNLQVVRYAPGASHSFSSEGSAQMLVLDGCLDETAVDAQGQESVAVCRRGDFADYPPGTRRTRASAGGALVLLPTHAPGSGGPAAERIQRTTDSFGPRGWSLSPDVASGSGGVIEGVWMKPLRIGAVHHDLLLIYFEPGAVYPAHVHTEPEQLFILSGEAEDKIFEQGGALREVTYRRGAFVDYPVPLFHSTHCPRGCMLVFGM